jgi:trehalose 6-phosphate phosphatase
MKSLLAPEHKELLAQVAFARVLLAFDFDGTLAPIVERHEDARMRSESMPLLAELCVLYPCAVISGRAKDDISPRLGTAAVKYVVGNHGLGPGASRNDHEREIALAKQLLEPIVDQAAGVEIENKRYSLALHYRRARQKRGAREAIQHAIGALPTPMRIVPGKFVFNIVPAGAPNKGDALLKLRALEQADVALYVGDDVSDEDVFRLDQPGRLITVRVGASQSSRATYCLPNQRAIDGLMRRLITLRRKH